MTLTLALSRFKILMNELKATYKSSGFKGLIRKYGWKLFAAFFVYYLFRDLILYVAIPALIARHFIQG